ncbi:diguanylate cyclase domain-containing protein, partial [Streptomyces minutiscleroticus]|uniref:diguanylate cyclase domain-containing protein n=1 Tax=Streptomyces minutiscleroticus TaxID=68238 RepID=UPI0033273186
MPASADGLADPCVHALGRRLAHWSAHRRALAARLGGDEFGVVAVLAPDTALADLAALREQLQQPLTHDRVTLTPSVSLGIEPFPTCRCGPAV